MPEALPSDLAEALRVSAPRRGRFGDPVYFFSETTSTNDVAAVLAERGAPEGTLVVASAQSSGRGRFGREWFSPPGAGLYVSIVCRDTNAVPLLTLAGGVAVAEGIRAATGLPVQIKWPNDVVVAGLAGERRRKLAGVLAEASTGEQGLQYVVLGFGINLRIAAFPAEIADRATSIEAELGRAPDAGVVLAETLVALEAVAGPLSHGTTDTVLERWRGLAPSACGSVVEWDTASGPLSGTSAGIANDGALLVRVGNRLERVISGVVRWR
jgi:BirA family transcriptional regulator, biotin operon repressor / biotin---[acetyl-CoA-carboxylase] ligase